MADYQPGTENKVADGLSRFPIHSLTDMSEYKKLVHDEEVKAVFNGSISQSENGKSSIQLEGIRKSCPPGTFLDLGVLGHFGTEIKTRKIVKIHKDFELYQVFMYNFLCQNVLVFSIYILFKNRIETFWSRDIRSIRGIRTF